MQAHLALEAAVAELESWRGRADIGERIDELAGLREGVAAAAAAALQGGLEPDAVAEVAARARRARGRAARAGRARAVGRANCGWVQVVREPAASRLP